LAPVGGLQMVYEEYVDEDYPGPRPNEPRCRECGKDIENGLSIPWYSRYCASCVRSQHTCRNCGARIEGRRDWMKRLCGSCLMNDSSPPRMAEGGWFGHIKEKE